MEIFEVTIHDYPPSHITAATRSKARYEAWLNFSDTHDCTFKEFQSFSKIRKGSIPAGDGYGEVRRQYNVDVQIGQRVRLKNEGSSDGREGEVVYPGCSTCYVHIHLDDTDYIAQVHPFSVEPLPTQQ